MKFYFIRNQSEFDSLMAVEREKIEAHRHYINRSIPDNEGSFYVRGYSNVANKQVDFLCDFQYS